MFSDGTTVMPKQRALRCVRGAWKSFAREPREYSSSLTAVFMPEGYDADKLRAVILENFDMSLGAGLSKLAGKVFESDTSAALTI